MTADQAMAAAAQALKDGGALQDAKEFLREVLANEPVAANEVEEAAKANGISERTLRRGRKELGVKVTKAGFEGGWQWAL